MKPTKRAVVDIGRKCNLNCKFCYHTHVGDLRKQGFRPVEELRKEISEARMRGNEYVDFTGGEPTICQDMPELLKYCRDLGMKTCIITNAIAYATGNTEKCLELVDSLLISIHGTKKVHDWTCQMEGARDAQVKFIEQVKAMGIPFRFNTVINKHNQHQLNNIIDEMELLKCMPFIWNFINFNPHHGWGLDKEGTEGIIADLDVVKPQLEFAIQRLEYKGIGVNVRYYPMCKIGEDYYKNICNDLHVVFDPFEWDYCIFPKTMERHTRWAIDATNNSECKAAPCNICSLQYVCGGANIAFKTAMEASGRCLKPVKPSEGGGMGCQFDFYRYREFNTLTLTLNGEAY